MQNMWSDVIGYVQGYTENFELFRPRVQFTCTEQRMGIIFCGRDNIDTTRYLL